MRRISTLATILITSFVLALAGLVASPIASASQNEGGISATFAFGSSVLSDDQKAAIKKALASSGSDASFIVTGTAGKLPGVSDSKVERLAKARAKAIKAYLVSLGVSKTSITTQVKIAEIGETPRSVGSYPTPAPTPTVTAVAAGSAPAAPAPTPTYAVGDRGPGGGIVFYVSAANFTSTGSTCGTACKYLEVAPATWQSAGASVADDAPSFAWSGNTSASIGATAQGIAIGTGYANTLAIVGQTSGGNAASKAGTIARAYRGPNSLTDWFLPSKEELNELCKYARGQTTGVLTVACVRGSGIFKSTVNAGSDLGGFTYDDYWSSSEADATQAFAQSFDDGTKFPADKFYSYGSVRPIRAF